jgi:hypothetical protein
MFPNLIPFSLNSFLSHDCLLSFFLVNIYLITSDSSHSWQKYRSLSKSEENVIMLAQRGHSISCCIFSITSSSSSISCDSTSNSGESNSVLIRSRKLVAVLIIANTMWGGRGQSLLGRYCTVPILAKILWICSFCGNGRDNIYLDDKTRIIFL